MKKWLLSLLMVAAGFALYAQPKAYIPIFIQPVTGVGQTLNDNAFITKMIIEEANRGRFILLGSQFKADFVVHGVITPYHKYEMNKDRYAPTDAIHSYNNAPQAWEEQLYVLQLTLKNTKTKKTALLQNLTYANLDDVYNFFPTLLHNLFAQIQDQYTDHKQRAIYTDDWLNKWLYLGINAFWSPRVYSGMDQPSFLANFGGGALLDFHFNDLLSLQAGVELSSDWPKTAADPDDAFRDLILEIPLSLQFVIQLSDRYMIAPYGGVHFNIPLMGATMPPVCSWMIGLQYGIKAGPGIFYVYPRFSMDMGESSLNEAEGAIPHSYQRYCVSAGVGYKFSFF